MHKQGHHRNSFSGRLIALDLRIIFLAAGIACLYLLNRTWPETTPAANGLRPGVIQQHQGDSQIWSLAFSTDAWN